MHLAHKYPTAAAKIQSLKLASKVMNAVGGKGGWSLQAEYLYPKLKAHN